jgi:23S rRNA (adenine2503-C2)-methyltransferase
VEYALIGGVNDTPAEVEALIAFCRGLLIHVNLIPVNPVTASGFARPPSHSVVAIAERLAAEHIDVSVRAERGADIDAACGQLRQRVGTQGRMGP